MLDNIFHMKISIIIPAYNNAHFTKQCVESIFAVGATCDFEVIVVDDGSHDETQEMLAALAHDVVVVRNEENRGFAKACNQGARRARGAYVVFLNNDTKVTEGWLDVLVREMDAHPQTGIAGSKLLYEDGSVQHAGIAFSDNHLPFNIYARERSDAPFVNRRRAFQAVTGACLIIARDFFTEIGGFDERYINGLEDVDLCLRARAAKRDVIYCPKSVVYHFESKTDGRYNHLTENEQLFLSLWGDTVVVDNKTLIADDGYLDDKDTVKVLLVEKDHRIAALEWENDVIKSSKFWALRTTYLAVKGKVMRLFGR